MRRAAAAGAAAAAALACACALLAAHLAPPPPLPRGRRDQRRLTVLEATPDASGAWYRVVSRGAARCEVQQFVRAGAAGFSPRYPGAPPPHRHTRAVEAFTVLAGDMGVWLEGEESRVARGGRVTIPAGARPALRPPPAACASGTDHRAPRQRTASCSPPPHPAPAGAAHFFWNAGAAAGRDLHVAFALAPCGGAPAFFETLAGLAADAGGDRGALPLLQRVLLYSDHGLEMAALAGRPLPRPLWRAMAAALPPLARALGYASAYPEYASAGGRRRGGGGVGGGGGPRAEAL